MTSTASALVCAALGAGVLVGCTGRDGRPGPTPSTTPPALDPDAAAVAAAIAREGALLAAYAGVAAADLVLADAVESARAHHVAHLDALRAIGERLGVTPPANGSATSVISSASASTSASTSASAVDPLRTARALLDLERRSSAAGVIAVASVVDPAAARLLAEVAASESQHATALFTALREGLLRPVPPTTPPLPGPAPSAPR